MEMSDQIYAPAALPQGVEPPVPFVRTHGPQCRPDHVCSRDKYLAVIETRSFGSRTCSLVTNID